MYHVDCADGEPTIWLLWRNIEKANANAETSDTDSSVNP